jgi:hypothetical protein
MAVTVQSVSSVARNTASTTVVITKPTGLAVGDLMVAHVVRSDNDQNSRSWSLTGWTSAVDTQGNDTGIGSSGMAALYKIADSGDVAASDFTFTVSSTADFLAGAIYRISGHSIAAPINASASAFINNDETPSFSNTITPTFADCLLLMLVHHYAGSSSSKDTSAYAITTSNPTWTEAYDNHNSTALTIGGAYANRPETTATGNSSFTSSGDATTDSGSIVLAIKPLQDASFTATAVSVAINIQAPTVQTGVNVSTTVVSTVVTINSPVIDSYPTISNVSKNSATWTAQSKN